MLLKFLSVHIFSHVTEFLHIRLKFIDVNVNNNTANIACLSIENVSLV